MQHTRLHSTQRMLFRCAHSLHEDALIPASFPVETFQFLHRLRRQCDHSSKPLGRFLLLISQTQFEDAILRVVLSSDYNELRNELEERQREKVDAAANEDFDLAITLRDATDAIKLRLSRFATSTIEIQPDHVLQAIADLGFDESIII